MTRGIDTMRDMMCWMGLASALDSARKTGLMDAIAGGGGTAAELAEMKNLDLQATRRVLEVLTEANITAREDNHYRPSELLNEFYSRHPGSHEKIQAIWGHVLPFLQTGKPLLQMDGTSSQRDDAYDGVVDSLAQMTSPAAHELAAALDTDGLDILDVAAGSGTWSLAMAREDDRTRVTGLDLPNVVEHFEKRAERLGLDNRTEILPGDVFEVDIPKAAYDRVIIGNFLRLETPERARKAVDRAASALRDSGDMIIVDTYRESAPNRGLERAIYALHLGIRTNSGGLHSRETVSEWLVENGLDQTEFIELEESPTPMSALVGRASNES